MKREIRELEKRVGEVFLKSKICSVLVGVSGGADSVALLTACCRIAPHLRLRIEAINCNFHLRGEESNRDSQFTSRLCEELGVKLHSIEYNVEEYIKDHPDISIEMACRELRYADFFRIMDKEGIDRVAVAHNTDDDIETMILNMLRSSGTRGLKGMEIDNGKVIRPLINTSRKEIETYLDALGSGYIVDSSNLTSEYRRNFIRREVLPLLESRWPGARKSLAKTISILKEEASIIDEFYRKQLKSLTQNEKTLLIYSEGVTRGTILRFLEPHGGNAEIADEILSSISKDFRKRTWKLTESTDAVLERHRLIIIDSKSMSTSPQFIWTRMAVNPTTMREVKGNKDHKIVYLPSEASSYIIRIPKEGDRLYPLGMRGSRLVSDIISDAKMDRVSKSKVRVFVRKSDEKIVWVSGLKRSRYDLIHENAEYCYKVQLIEMN